MVSVKILPTLLSMNGNSGVDIIYRCHIDDIIDMHWHIKISIYILNIVIFFYISLIVVPIIDNFLIDFNR